MRKLIAILLLSLYSISVFQMQEFLAIPKFIEHYTHHENQDDSMTLWSFIKLHYFSGDVKDADYKEDMQLPFKAIDNSYALNLSFILPQFEWVNPLYDPQEIAYHSFFYHFFKEQSFLNLLLRPPIEI